MQSESMLLHHVLQHVAKDVVFGHHLVDVEAVLEALHAMC